ncbi:TRAM domain-containing protein, partial [bacterium]|nr:TRAM domain-containing protein [bacterium]
LMLLQAGISDQKNQIFVGKTIKILLEKLDENDDAEYIGRSYAHAPDVDGHIILVNVTPDMMINRFYDVKITDSDVYDLYGEIVL